jgi:septum formation protein
MIYLCSTSPRRRALLKEKKIAFRLLRPDYKETPIRTKPISKGVARHALGKALSAVKLVKNGIILGADTVVVFRGRAIGKPRDRKHAVRMLSMLQGNWHEVITAVALIKIKDSRAIKRAVFSVRSRVRIRKMAQEEILAYFRKVTPLDKAGAYAAQANKAPQIVEAIRGSFSNVVGLPMKVVKKLLSRSAKALAKRLGHHVDFQR